MVCTKCNFPPTFHGFVIYGCPHENDKPDTKPIHCPTFYDLGGQDEES
jgi:hypothetical protein